MTAHKIIKLLNTSLCAFCKTVEAMVEVVLRFIGFKRLLGVKNWFYDYGFVIELGLNSIKCHLIVLSGKALCLIKTVQMCACCPLLH